MSENPRLQTEQNQRNCTAMSSDAAEGPFKSRIPSGVLSPAYRATKQLQLTQQQRINAAKHKVKPERECVGRADVKREAPQRQRQNKSISAAHPAIYLNTHSHKLLRRAIRIWKMPVPILNCTGSSKPKPRSFQEQLKQVEMLRNRSGDSDARTRSVRDPGTDWSPSPSMSSEPGRRPAHNTSRRNREQLCRHRMLSRRGKQGDEKRHRPREGQSSPAGSCWVKGSCEYQDDGRDDPVIRAPERRTSRRLWRRTLDSSSSDTSPINPRPDTHSRKHSSETSPINPRPDTHTRQQSSDTNPINLIPDTHTRTHSSDTSPMNPRPDTHTRQHTRVSFYLPDESKTPGCSWTEVHLLHINSNLSKEASASEQKNVDKRDSSDLKLAVQTSEKLIPQSPLKITATSMQEHNSSPQSVSEASLSPQLKICEDCVDINQIEMPSHTHTQSDTDTPAPQSGVKWKSVLLQRFSVSFGNQCPT